MLSEDLVTSYFKNLSKQDNFQNPAFQYDATNKAIDRHENIPFKIFFSDYMSKNKPCIISLKNIESWKSSSDWVVDDKPNFDFLEQNYGSSQVPVADCNTKEFNSQKKTNMLLKEYMEYWRDSNKKTNSDLLYLKDWHFKRQYPEYEAYNTPEYFRSDWLNEFCEKQDDDYQFVYMGPKGTWTPLHSDVFGSYSWSVNLCGCKKWILFPPGQENFLRDERKQVKYMVDENYLDDYGIFHLKVIQRAKEVIFVPSGWYHQVWNLEDTISINHNWFNGCNIHFIWTCLHHAAVEVEREIADIKEFEGWEDQWQIILKAHHGMNYADFLQILQFIVKKRTDEIRLQGTSDINWQSVYDLLIIKTLCNRIITYKIPDTFIDCINNLFSCIKDFLSKYINIESLCIE